MAIVSFEIPDNHVQRFLDGMAEHYGYQTELDGQENPESKQDYVRRKIRHEWVIRVRRQELSALRQAISVEDIDITD